MQLVYPSSLQTLQVENQRVAFHRGEMKPNRLEELEEAGFVFKVEPSPVKKPYRSYSYEKMWKRHLDELSEYGDKHGNFDVPTSYADNPKLAKWVENQRGSYNRNTLSQERIDLLKEIGFDFGKRKRGRKSKTEFKLC